MHDVLEPGAFAAQVLRMLGIVPDLTTFQLGVDLDQTVTLVFVVKDSPAARRNARAGPSPHCGYAGVPLRISGIEGREL
jgi:hypothetical protein